MWAIAGKELRILFFSPLAWGLLAVAQFLLAWVFLGALDHYLQAQGKLAAIGSGKGFTAFTTMPLYGSAAMMMLFLAPVICMRLVSEERRQHTLPLLLAAPISLGSLVLGKYLAVLWFFLPLQLLTLAMPLSLAVGGPVDLGHVLAAALGLSLFTAAACAIGLYTSTLTPQPALAAAAGGGILLLLWSIDWAGNMAGQSGLFAALSLNHHYTQFKQGVVDTRALFFFSQLIVVFLALATLRLESLRQ